MCLGVGDQVAAGACSGPGAIDFVERCGLESRNGRDVPAPAGKRQVQIVGAQFREASRREVPQP